MKLKEMLQGVEMESRSNTVAASQIPEVEKWLGMKLGPQLKEYILEYSCLYSEEMGDPFLSIVAELGEKNEMVTYTKLMRNRYRGTENYIMLELGALYEVDVVVDTEDNVFYIDGNDCSIIDAEMKLFDYIYLRLKYGDWLFMSDKERAEVEMSEEDRLRYADA